MVGWGQAMMAMHNTRKLTLAQDKYSRQLHYVNDNGANYCYCKWWPKCEKSKGGCVPMHITLAALKTYHAELNLPVGHYHLDPFWWSQRPNGGCEHGATAINMSASWFHFPQGLGAVGLEMQLIVKYINGKCKMKTRTSFDTPE